MFIVKRSEFNPIVAPVSGRPWETLGAFNGCPVKKGDEIHLLYRAIGNPDALMTPAGISTIGDALSTDGEHFPSRRQFIVPEHEWEKFGCEDPRVTYFEGKYVIFYTALGGVPFGAHNIKVAAAISKDLETVSERHLVTPFNAKAMALFPERVDGKITVIFSAHTDEPPTHIAIAQCDKLEELWDETFWEDWHTHIQDHVVHARRYDNDHIEVGAPPIKTKDGWLVVYSYIQNYFGGGQRVFGIEAILLDLKNPREIVGRTNGPFLVPEEIYERYGAVPNIVFPSGALLASDGRLDVYYGAADTVCAKASLYLSDLLDAMIPTRRENIAVRAKENPIIEPVPTHPWESKAAFNAGAIDIDGTVHILYRALSDKNVSTLGYATSKNGVKITKRDPEPVYLPREEFELQRGGTEMNSGCEDPRLSLIGNTVYLAYTAFNALLDPGQGFSRKKMGQMGEAAACDSEQCQRQGFLPPARESKRAVHAHPSSGCDGRDLRRLF
jgi:beta-1,2-mannobiose phosphorylase / 1,2-beta-oligomannan phosphorylase